MKPHAKKRNQQFIINMMQLHLMRPCLTHIMFLFLILTLIQAPFIYSDFNTTNSSTELKLISKRYNNNNRCYRCVDFGKGFSAKSVKMEKPERHGILLKYESVSDCSRSASDIKSDYKTGLFDRLIVHDNISDLHWEEYKSFYNKDYKTVHHEATALEKWRENLRKVAKHNKKFMAGTLSYSLHLNHFGDLHVTDYFRKILKLMPALNLFDPAEDHHKTTFRKTRNHSVPRKLDWRSKGFKPRREEQWQCGACYAFAVTHAVQAQLFKKHGQWHELSPQQIVDCSFRDGNMGCDGGSLRSALRYASRAGLISETHYPYVGKRGRCKYSRSLARAQPVRWATLPRDEAALERALTSIGPLAVAVNAAPFTFQLYRSGIYDDPFCTPWTMNHAMLLVGYTPEYWVLLNWWGRSWGEDGYIRIRRGFNRCGVANMATYVEL